jgi:hypothetical protein
MQFLNTFCRFNHFEHQYSHKELQQLPNTAPNMGSKWPINTAMAVVAVAAAIAYRP